MKNKDETCCKGPQVGGLFIVGGSTEYLDN